MTSAIETKSITYASQRQTMRPQRFGRRSANVLTCHLTVVKVGAMGFPEP